MEYIAKVSTKGQVVIPAEIRSAIKLEPGDDVTVELNDENEIILKKVPNDLEFDELLKRIPVERVEFDELGYYDPKKAPFFHEWMNDGDDDWDKPDES